MEWARQIPRPLCVRYNAYTRSLDILDNKRTLGRLAASVRADVDVLATAIARL